MHIFNYYKWQSTKNTIILVIMTIFHYGFHFSHQAILQYPINYIQWINPFLMRYHY
jgi:hypothetical protein